MARSAYGLSLIHILNHDWLSIVGSDNSSIPLYQKHWGEGDFRKIPNGCPGAGDRLNALWTYGVEKGKITRQKLVDVYATLPAKLNGIFPQKGTIDIGTDGDLVIFDPEYRGTVTVESNPTGVEDNVYEGCEQIGRADTCLLYTSLRERDDRDLLNDALGDPDKVVIAQIAPAVRTAWGEQILSLIHI